MDAQTLPEPFASIDKLVASSARIRGSASLILLSLHPHLQRAASVEVRVRDICAACACGASRFFATGEPPYPIEALFVCEVCGEEVVYGALLERIGEEAMRRANAAIDNLKRRNKERRALLTPSPASA
jgi:hypothetical protein